MEERYKELFENIKIPVSIVVDDTISLVNSAFEELVGYSRKEIEYKKRWQEFIATEEDIKRLEYYRELRIKDPNRAPHKYVVKIKSKDDNIKHVLVIPTITSEAREYLIFLVDITDIVKAEEKTRALLEMIHKVNRNTTEATDETRLLEDVLSILRDTGMYKEILIGTPDNYRNYTYSTEMAQGNESFGRLNILKEEELNSMEKEIIEDVAKELGHSLSLLRTKKELFFLEEKYESIFENAPIALLEENISKVVEYLEKHRISELEEDTKNYLSTHLAEYIELIEFSNINKAGLRLYNALNKKEIRDKFTSLMGEILERKLSAIANGLSEDEFKTRIFTLDGKEKFIYVRWFLLSLKDKPPTLLTAIVDITQEEMLKESLRRKIAEVKESLIQTIEVLSSIVEIKDYYTFEHQKKVSQISSVIARRLNLSQEMIEQLYIAGLLHDIGKIGIPAEILNKPGKLNRLELEIIKLHPEIGYRLLRKIKPLEYIADIVLQHHERLNGSGYPRGIKGNSIILPARIIAVADVLEAMSSHRPYRPALPIEKVIDELTIGKGELYDSEVVDVCIELIKTDKSILSIKETERDFIGDFSKFIIR